MRYFVAGGIRHSGLGGTLRWTSSTMSSPRFRLNDFMSGEPCVEYRSVTSSHCDMGVSSLHRPKSKSVSEIYWRGSHVAKLEKRVEAILNQIFDRFRRR